MVSRALSGAGFLNFDLAMAGRFIFAVDLVPIGRFTGVSGLSAEIDVKTVTEGGQNQFEHKLPGRMSWPNLVLTRGVILNDQLFEWFQRSSGDGFAGNDDRIERSTAVLIALGTNRRPVRTWAFDGAFPVKWQGPDLKSDSNDVATETLEIAHHGIQANFRSADLRSILGAAAFGALT